MIDNLPQSTGRSLEEWFAVLEGTNLSKHTELMNHLKQVHGVSHGFADGIVLRYRETVTVDRLRRGTAISSRPVRSGARPRSTCRCRGRRGRGFVDVEVAPKRTGPPSAFEAVRRGRGAECQAGAAGRPAEGGAGDRSAARRQRDVLHKVNLSEVGDVDDEVVGWLRAAYGRA